MKLPKGFGLPGGSGNMMRQAQEAMARAQTLEQELALERIEVDKGPVKATFDGTGVLIKISIAKEIIDPEDAEALEDLVLTTVREGFDRATERRNEKVQEIMPNIQGL